MGVPAEKPSERRPTRPSRVTKAVKEKISTAEQAAVVEATQGRVMKVLLLDEGGEPVGEWASAQLPEDPFSGMRGIQEPPYKLEQLVYLAEMHPVHSAALEQKTADVIGKGWEWESPEIKGEDEREGNEDERDELNEWFEALCPDEEGTKEIVHAAWLDYETTGWGLLELARDNSGVLRRMYHIPAHTVRAHRDGFRLVQIRQDKKVWFARWGAMDPASSESDPKPIEVDAKTGSMKAVRNRANEIFVVRKPSRRSSWYGIPGYISSMGWITLALAARDDNLLFFANRREPRWAIIMTNLQDDPTVVGDVQRAFTIDLQQPHRNILIPIAGEGKIDFQKLSDNAKDGSFDKLSERADKAVMIAHRVPGERLANSQVGPLGGNATMAASRIYKEGVITPAQELLATRLNRLIKIEFGREFPGREPTWDLVMDDLDISNDSEEHALVRDDFKANLITLREARQELKRGPLKEWADGTETEDDSVYNDMLFGELPSGKSAPPEPPPLAGTPPELEVLEDGVAKLLESGRDMHDRLDRLSEIAEADVK